MRRLMQASYPYAISAACVLSTKFAKRWRTDQCNWFILYQGYRDNEVGQQREKYEMKVPLI